MAEAGAKKHDLANGPLIVTSKTNPAVAELITAAAWEALQEGGTPLDAAERGETPTRMASISSMPA